MSEKCVECGVGDVASSSDCCWSFDCYSKAQDRRLRAAKDASAARAMELFKERLRQASASLGIPPIKVPRKLAAGWVKLETPGKTHWLDRPTVCNGCRPPRGLAIYAKCIAFMGACEAHAEAAGVFAEPFQGGEVTVVMTDEEASLGVEQFKALSRRASKVFKSAPWKCPVKDCKTPTAGPVQGPLAMRFHVPPCGPCQDATVAAWTRTAEGRKAMEGGRPEPEPPAYHGPRESTAGGYVWRPGARYGTWR